MGYRANNVIVQREYGEQPFSNWEEFVYTFIPAVEKKGLEIQANDNLDYFEMLKEDLVKYVVALPDDDQPAEDYPSYSNRELKNNLAACVTEAPDVWISLEWF